MPAASPVRPWEKVAHRSAFAEVRRAGEARLVGESACTGRLSYAAYCIRYVRKAQVNLFRDVGEYVVRLRMQMQMRPLLLADAFKVTLSGEPVSPPGRPCAL